MNKFVAFDLNQTQDMDTNLGNTICFLSISNYVDHVNLDMIVVHGDRMDTFAGAVVRSGEDSGTIDESIRHAFFKVAPVHFVCIEEARNRWIPIVENGNRIYIIDSPDIGIILSEKLPDF